MPDVPNGRLSYVTMTLLTRIECFMSTGTILTRGFPQPSHRPRFETTPNFYREVSHVVASTVESSFVLESGVDLEWLNDELLWPTYSLMDEETNEGTLTFLTAAAIKEVLACFPQFESIRFGSLNTMIREKDSDLWALRACDRENTPYCLVDVIVPPARQPHATELNATMYGRMFDSLLHLRRNFGIRAPFGIITTYFTWWICWLPDCDAVAGASSVTPSAASPEVENVRRLHIKTLTLPAAFGEDTRTRERFNAVETFCLHIGSVVSKALRSGVSEVVHCLHSKLTCYQQDGLSWEGLDPETEVTTDQMPHRTTDKFYRLNFLGQGADGSVQAFCDANGYRCAAKFSSKIPPKDALTKEAKFWRSINGVHTVFIKTLNKEPALIMPYLYPVSKEERKSPVIQELVIQLLECSADRGYLQTDAAWRHVGWYRYKEPHKLMLLDFGHMVKITNLNRQKTINDSLKNFCVCQKRGRGECVMCVYMQKHKTKQK